VVLAATDRWSSRSVRYIALALMAPATLMYFGYLEVGYLSLSAAAFPFIARDLINGDELTPGLLFGATLYGLGAGDARHWVSEHCRAVCRGDRDRRSPTSSPRGVGCRSQRCRNRCRPDLGVVLPLCAGVRRDSKSCGRRVHL
jgi:hypothetical protein